MQLKTILIGSLVLLASLAAMLLIGRILVPPAQEVFVAVGEIQAGETLTPDKVRLESVHITSTTPYLTSADIERYGYARVVEAIHQGTFIPKASLSFTDNPAAANRVSLALGDPELVAMAVPVTPLTCPSEIAPGDRVSLDVSVGSANLLSGSFPAAASTASGAGQAAGSFPSGASPFETASPTTTPQPSVSLPVTKNLVVSGRVLSVLYNEQVNPVTLQSPGSAAAPQVVRGDIKALVVAVPGSLQEALAFAIANGEVRVAVLDPNATDPQTNLTAGMSWDDLLAFFTWQRQEWLATPHATGQIDPPGAAALLPALEATTTPTPTSPAPSVTPAALEGSTTPAATVRP